MSLTLTKPEVLTAGQLACPPRFSTPRNPDRATLGHLVGEIARRLGKPLMPWQQFVADVALEYDADGFCYDEADILVPRQSGKTTLIVSKTLMRLILMVRSHGPQRSTYVAQKRLDARRKFERDFAPMLRKAKGSFPEVPHARARPTRDTEWRLGLNNGSEAFEFGTGSWWQVGVPDDSGGHGDTLDDYTIDEARFQEDATVEEGLGPSMITRPDAQGWVVSTAGTAGNQTGAGQRQANSVYLWRKVKAGREACESGNHGRVAYFEWSAPDTASTAAEWGDPRVWRLCMPALGHTITERRIQAEWEKALRGGDEGIDNFRRAYLNQWPEIPTLVDESLAEHVLGREAWAGCADPSAVAQEPMRLALDVSFNRDHACFAVAAPDGQGHTLLEVVDYRPGVDWVVERASSKPTPGPLLVAAKSPASTFTERLRAAGVDVEEVAVDDHAAGCAGLVDGVREGTFRHLDQSDLNGAVRAAEKKFYAGEQFLWDRRRSGDDICPLVAVTLAAWGLGQPDDEGGPNLW